MVKIKRYSRENAKEPFPAAQWQIEGSSDWIWEGGEMRHCWQEGAKLDDNCALYLTSAPKIPFGIKMGAVIKLWKAVVWKYIIYKQQAAKRTQILGPVCFFLYPLIFTSSWVLEKISQQFTSTTPKGYCHTYSFLKYSAKLLKCMCSAAVLHSRYWQVTAAIIVQLLWDSSVS